MKNLIVLAALVIGFSAQADNHAKKTTTSTTTTTEHSVPGTHVAMTKKDAEIACSKEGKKGADLATCVTEKTAPKAH